MSPIRVYIGVALAVVAAGCGGSKYSSSPTSPSSTSPSGFTVSMPQGASSLGAGGFVPSPLTVPVGSTVTWVNNDTVSSSHDVAADNGAFDSGTMTNGARYSYTYQTRGTFPYHCARHPGMVGTVVVQ